MKNLVDYYILGEPIDTDIGECRFIKVRNYPDLANDLAVMTLTKAHVIKLLTDNKNLEAVKILEDKPLFDIVFSIADIRVCYLNVLTNVFKEESLSKINTKNFNEYRNLILKMNCQKEEKINPNPEIQRAIERSKRVKAMNNKGEKLHFVDMVTSIVGYNGLSYENIKDFTLYQLYMTYQRIGQIKSYDTSTLFATVPSDKKHNIESWSKHIDLFEEEQHFVTENEFNKNTGNVFKD